jgi:hypothetical protein
MVIAFISRLMHPGGLGAYIDVRLSKPGSMSSITRTRYKIHIPDEAICGVAEPLGCGTGSGDKRSGSDARIGCFQPCNQCMSHWLTSCIVLGQSKLHLTRCALGMSLSACGLRGEPEDWDPWGPRTKLILQQNAKSAVDEHPVNVPTTCCCVMDPHQARFFAAQAQCNTRNGPVEVH